MSDLGSDVFYWYFDLRLLFLYYCGFFKGVGLGSDVYFSFFDLRLVFLYYCAWFKGVGLRF